MNEQQKQGLEARIASHYSARITAAAQSYLQKCSTGIEVISLIERLERICIEIEQASPQEQQKYTVTYKREKYATVGGAVRDLQLQAKLSYAELAKQVQVSLKSIYALQRNAKPSGRRKTYLEKNGLETKKRFAAIFELTPEEEEHFMSLPFYNPKTPKIPLNKS